MLRSNLRLGRVRIIGFVLTLSCAACDPVVDRAVPIETACTVIDGDTIRCGEERIRLLGIDAPEMPGSCTAGRDCAPGDPYAAADSLFGLVEKGPLSIIRFKKDRYGRTLAIIRSGEVDLSCQQIKSGHAVYVARWDQDNAVRSTCPKAVQR